MNAPQFSLGPRDRLWTVLQSHEGHWTEISDLMFEAGFIPTQRDKLTAFTSFYWNLEQLKPAIAGEGFYISEANYRVMLSKV